MPESFASMDDRGAPEPTEWEERIAEIRARVEAAQCGNQLEGWTCVLKPGPHRGWNHRDKHGHWWTQVRLVPLSDAEAMRLVMDVDLLVAEVDRLTAAKRILFRSLEARSKELARLNEAAQGALDALDAMDADSLTLSDAAEDAREQLKKALASVDALAQFAEGEADHA